MISGKRIGIMGGTFDPIHYGHLMLAEQIRTSFHLDQVLFIPVGKAPHKDANDTADKKMRYEMTQLAIVTNPYFLVSDIEIKKDGVTYTIDTIKTIKAKLKPEDTLFFITGADALLLLESWKDYADLITRVNFIGATRPGVDTNALAEKIDSLKRRFNVQIDLCYIPALAISSTDIRDRVDQEKSIKYLLPESVETYIHDCFLYKSHHPRFSELYDYLASHLTPKRFKHSVETAHIARKLAVYYGADPVKAEFAGLCHDFAKETKSKKMIEYIDAFDIFKDPSIIAIPNLAHGEVGAAILKKSFEITDEEILDAIRWHTYGHLDLSLLSKIVYVADIIEQSRTFDGVDVIRKLAFQSLDDAILVFDDQCAVNLANRKMSMHTYTLQMVEQIKAQKNNWGFNGSNIDVDSKNT